MNPRPIIALLAAASLATPLAAESAAIAVPMQNSAGEQRSEASAGLAMFTPAATRRDHRIDYAHWDEALQWLVIPMGPSIRIGAGRVEPRTGTRRIYGHESRYRLEGNRVAFSFVTPEIREAVSAYRADLERVGTDLDITTLPRNEQLAFWLNLHNVAVIEALLARYPLARADERVFGDGTTELEDAKLVTVAGVALSPRDIRERIVYPNWRDPKVIYGFWRGAIGGPSIQRVAFTGGNVDALLSLSAEEFVNSLRGVERWGGRLRLSPIYQEAAPFYFADEASLRAHLATFAGEDVARLVSETEQVRYKDYIHDIADLARGERDPALSFLNEQPCGSGECKPNILVSEPVQTRINPAIQRLMAERQTKLQRAIDRGIRLGTVIYGGEGPDGSAPEVE